MQWSASAKEIWVQAEAFATRSLYCVNHVDAFEECQSTWAFFLYVAIGGLAVIGLIVTWHFISYRLKWRRVMRQRWLDQQVAPEDVMSRAKWAGDASPGADLSTAEIARQIRAEKNRQKLRGTAAQEPAKGDRHLGIDILHK